jgi:hypothetical protein
MSISSLSNKPSFLQTKQNMRKSESPLPEESSSINYATSSENLVSYSYSASDEGSLVHSRSETPMDIDDVSDKMSDFWLRREENYFCQPLSQDRFAVVNKPEMDSQSSYWLRREANYFSSSLPVSKKVPSNDDEKMSDFLFRREQNYFGISSNSIEEVSKGDFKLQKHPDFRSCFF